METPAQPGTSSPATRPGPREIVKRAAAECAGTAILVLAVIVASYLATLYSDGHALRALLIAGGVTGFCLYALMLQFGPISGAHFNPLITIVSAVRRELPASQASVLIAAQIAGTIAGIALANMLLELQPAALGIQPRGGAGPWLAEGLASFALILIVLGTRRFGTMTTALALGAFIPFVYYYSDATSIASPAMTLARAPLFAVGVADILGFVAAQVAGALLASVLGRHFERR